MSHNGKCIPPNSGYMNQILHYDIKRKHYKYHCQFIKLEVIFNISMAHPVRSYILTWIRLSRFYIHQHCINNFFFYKFHLEFRLRVPRMLESANIGLYRVDTKWLAIQKKCKYISRNHDKWLCARPNGAKLVDTKSSWDIIAITDWNTIREQAA